MARRQKSQKTFQQRQTEKRQRDDDDRALVEDTASRFSCTNQLAADFAHQCETRIEDLDFDLLFSELADELWANPRDSDQPVLSVLRALDTERRRHRDALIQLRAQLLPMTGHQGAHHHLETERAAVERVVRSRLLPDTHPRPVEISAIPGEC